MRLKLGLVGVGLSGCEPSLLGLDHIYDEDISIVSSIRFLYRTLGH